jgi:sigma-E factor negative regulatory protein RseC
VLEQQGRVTAASGGRVSVRLGDRSGCPACDAGQGCGAGVFGRLLRRRPVILEFENHLGARPGQCVVVGMPEGLFLKLTARFYLFPLVWGLGGAACGHHLALMAQAGPGVQDLAALAGAAAAVTAAVRWSRSRPIAWPGVSAVRLLRLRIDNFQEMEK